MAEAPALSQEPEGRPIVLRWLRRVGGFIPSDSSRWNIVLAVLPFLIAFVVYLGAYFIMDPSTTGDEPHYLLYAYSLVEDHDVDLRNNYEEGDVGRFFASSRIDPHAFDYRGDGRWISKRNIGLPILIAPVLFLHESVFAARVLLIVLSALLAHQIFRLLQDLNIAEPRFLWPAWAAVAFCLPLLTFSAQIYPEVPAALLLIYGARMVLVRGSSGRSLFMASLAAAALPWLHMRFLLFTVGLTLAITYRLLDGRISWSSLKASFPRLLLLTPVPLSLLLTAVAFTSWYGNPLPPVPFHHVPGTQRVEWGWLRLYKHGLGFFLSPQFGWLPYAPVHWLGVVGLVALARIYRLSTVLALVFIGGYLVIISPGTGGHSFPARFLVVLVPFIGIPLLLILKTSRPVRVLFVGLLGLSLTMGAMGILHHTDLYPSVPGRATLPLARDLQEAWPILHEGPTGFRVFPEKAPRQVGQLVAESGTDSLVASTVAYASPTRDPAGFLSYGPYKSLRAGTYLARFKIAARGDQPADQIATLDIFANPGKVLAKKGLRLLDLPAGGEYATVEVPFWTPTPSYPLETRVYYTGKAEVWLKSIAVVPTSEPSGVAEDFPSWPRSLLWVVGTIFVAFLVPRAPTAWGSRSDKGEPR